MFQRERGRDFEKSWMRVPLAHEVAKFRKTACDFLFENHFAVHSDSFAKSDQVRGSEQSGPIFLCAANRIDHRANRSFAICTGDVDNACVRRSDTQLANQSPNIFETELDA